ncbi:hypothetical protein ABZ897_55315 [Nonomuraea sp. NPDC046802]|uniref:hypothetical protein n=1 Tax=Nonomuraea sp. NPDC046802 TaxID=3154919 RepID=UPI0033F807CE
MLSADLAQVVARICTRITPETPARVESLPGGGIRVETDPALEACRRWVGEHRLLRELRLVGWQVGRSGRGDLQIGGWSTVHLAHRAQILSTAAQAMSEAAPTVAMLLLALRDFHRAHPSASVATAGAAAGAAVTAWYQRWPQRLADLEGLDRQADQLVAHVLLQRCEELEQQVLTLSQLHRRITDDAVTCLGDLMPRWGSGGEVSALSAQLMQRAHQRFADELAAVPSIAGRA